MGDSSMGAGLPGHVGSVPEVGQPDDSPLTLTRGFTFRSAFTPVLAGHANPAIGAMAGQILQVNGGEVRCRA